jgi:hypothetical protein
MVKITPSGMVMVRVPPPKRLALFGNFQVMGPPPGGPTVIETCCMPDDPLIGLLHSRVSKLAHNENFLYSRKSPNIQHDRVEIQKFPEKRVRAFTRLHGVPG